MTMSIWHRYGDNGALKYMYTQKHNDQSLNLFQCSLRSHLAEIISRSTFQHTVHLKVHRESTTFMSF